MVWIKLTSEQAYLRYRVPMDIAKNETNAFYGMERQPGSSPFDDGPWSFLAFLANRKKANVVTFHIDCIHFEALEFENFNPLLDQSNYLSLSKRELTDLVRLLLKQAVRLSSTSRSENTPKTKTFRQLESQELVDFHIHPEWFLGQRMCYYLQVRNPLAKMEQTPMATILLLSTGDHRQPTSHLFIQIAHFPFQALHDSSFNPMDDSLGRIHLDRYGMEELAQLLQAKLQYFADG